MNMKTWTNPAVEELEVKLTADGPVKADIENVPGWVDLPILGYEKEDKTETQS